MENEAFLVFVLQGNAAGKAFLEKTFGYFHWGMFFRSNSTLFRQKKKIIMQILDDKELPHKGFVAAGQSWAASSTPHLNTFIYVVLVGHYDKERR